MIKLGDLISAAYSNVVIMDSVYETISINPCHVEKLKIINPDILECVVEKLYVVDNTIRVWLKEDEK